MGTACSPAYAQMLLLPCSYLIRGHVQSSDAKTVSMSWTPNLLTLTYFRGKHMLHIQQDKGSIFVQLERCITIYNILNFIKIYMHIHIYIFNLNVFCTIKISHKARDAIQRGRCRQVYISTFAQMDCNSSHPWHNCHLQLNWADKQDK